MSTLTLDLEPDLLALLHSSQRPPSKEARELIILELYRRGKLSSGKAAELLNLTKDEFIRYASDLGIAYYDMTDEEWARERSRSEQL